MGNLVFQATLGGQVNLVGPNTASTFNLNVPAVSSTIATTSGTETLTNKTLTSPVISGGTIDNAVIGGTTAAAGSFTTLSASSTLSVTGAGTIQGLTVGKGAGAVSTNTAVGASALAANTTGTRAVAVGYEALKLNTTGDRNHAFGLGALGANVDGNYNTGVGYAPLGSNTSGSSNVAVGYAALNANTTASNNTAVGYQAGYSNTTASYNTALGHTALYSATTGYSNTSLGFVSGYSLTTGYLNTFVGKDAGYYVTTGAKNTVLGAYTGNQGGLDIRTSSNYIVLSDGDGNPRCYYNNSGNFWAFNNGGAASSTVLNVYNENASSPFGVFVQFTAAAPNNTSNYLFRGQDSSTTCFTIWSNGTTSGRSDARLKKNIADATPKLDDLCRLQVRNYEWTESIDGHKEIGLIAQEVETVFPGLVVTHDLEKDGDDYKEVKYSAFVPILIKALQELKAEFDAYKEAHP